MRNSFLKCEGVGKPLIFTLGFALVFALPGGPRSVAAATPKPRSVKTVCTNALTTVWGRAVTPENCWREYPRPQLVRTGWASLNGSWDYAVTSVSVDEPKSWDGKIVVPYPIESTLSGVGRKVTPDDQIWYRRTFSLAPRKGFRTILNFERVDFRASVFVNGFEAMDTPHEGGNVPFSVDITDFVREGENELKVLVWDPTDTHLGGTGKQVLKYWTCFFGASSGIVGGVWLEDVPETYLADYRVTTDLAKGAVTIEPEVKGNLREAVVDLAVSFAGKPLVSGRCAAGEKIALTLPKPLRLWSCATPNLYDISLVVTANGASDRVTGYFGVRDVATRPDAKGHRRVTVNGAFTYLLATLDQGWWPDCLLTPPSEAACRFDVDFHKKAGFNAIRKHIKIEPRAFYAHCDRLGVMVLQDIPSFGPDNRQGDLSYANKRYGFYRQELKACVDHLRNHPSIVMWIPFNEGWGQPSADKTRFTNKWLRRYDPTRLINGPSGWNDYEGGTVQHYANWTPVDCADSSIYTDCVDLHHYPDARMHAADGKRVSFLGEFGGMGVDLIGHTYDPKGRVHHQRPESDSAWRGQQERAYADRVKGLLPLIRKGLGGSVYTESVDQFWELGGFVTFDRAIVKLNYAFLQRLHREVYDAADEAARTPPPPRAPGLDIDWEPAPRVLDWGEWPRLRVLADGRYAFTYSRSTPSEPKAHSAIVRFSSDCGKTWSAAQTTISAFEGYQINNPELTQLPANHPHHPNRLIVAANIRPRRPVDGFPSSVGCAVSDDAGRTWRGLQNLLPIGHDGRGATALPAGQRGGAARSCWEAFVAVRPDGTLDLYYSDVVRVGAAASARTVSRFVSCDGGDTWKGPEVVMASTPLFTSPGIPCPLTSGKDLYLAFEARSRSARETRPFVALTSAADPWKAAPVLLDPLANLLAEGERAAAPYLVETARHVVLAAHVSQHGGNARLCVWAGPKGAGGAGGGGGGRGVTALPAFVPVSSPTGDDDGMCWCGLTPLGGDEIMATCQRHADLLLVRGRIRGGGRGATALPAGQRTR